MCQFKFASARGVFTSTLSKKVICSRFSLPENADADTDTVITGTTHLSCEWRKRFVGLVGRLMSNKEAEPMSGQICHTDTTAAGQTELLLEKEVWWFGGLPDRFNGSANKIKLKSMRFQLCQTK